jgi:hypothetical protein
MGRNVLVVSTVDHAEATLRTRLGEEVDEVRVVVPVVKQGFLDWLANDEAAFSQAETEAERLADALPGETVDSAAGEADIQLAIQDALAEFAADEIVVALHPEDEASFAERLAQGEVRPSINGVPMRTVIVHETD